MTSSKETMYRMLRRYLISLVLVIGLFASATQAADASVSKLDLERRAFRLVNHHRVEMGLERLRWNTHVAQSARVHSKNMAHGRTEFGHDGFSDRVEQIRLYISRLSSAGENVAYTNADRRIAKRVVNGWLNSAGHRANIENAEYTVSGMGVGKHDNYFYFTQMFVGKN